MASKTPPKKLVYPKQEQPRRPKPTRPVYPPDAGTQRAPRRPAEGRVIFDYEKETARTAAPNARAGQTAAPFVNLAPPGPAGTPPVQNGFAAGAGRPERARRGASPTGEPRRPAVPFEEPRRATAPESGARRGERQAAGGETRVQRAPTGRRADAPLPAEPVRSAPSNRPPQEHAAPGRERPAQPQRPQQAMQKKKPPKKRPPKQPPHPLTPRQLQRRRRRRAALAGLLAVILLGIGLWASATVLFKISEIVVETPEGDVAYDTSRITEAFGHVQGENLFGFQAKETQDRKSVV